MQDVDARLYLLECNSKIYEITQLTSEAGKKAIIRLIESQVLG
jgi:hypothetical protein